MDQTQTSPAATTGLNLVKGQKIDITKGAAGLALLAVGMGWDVNAGNGPTYDLDAFCILLGADGKVVGKDLHQAVCYFNNLNLHGVTHTGDNLTGAGDGDDETIHVDIKNVDPSVDQILFCVNIFDAPSKGNQNFGMVKNAFIRAYNDADKKEIFKFDLSEDYSMNNAVVFGKLYRRENEWKFEAVGKGTNGSIAEVANQYL